MKHIHDDRLLFVINPKSGGGKSIKAWTKAETSLRQMGIEFSQVVSEYHGHAIEIAKKAALDGFQKIVAVGGDGTAHQVANGILQSGVSSDKVCLGLIPVGTGNDWIKTAWAGKKNKQPIQTIIYGTKALQDVGLVKYTTESGKKERYFINILGGGYDAYVGKYIDARREEGKHGALVYLEGMIKCMGSFKAIPAKLFYDGKEKDMDIYTMAAGICKYNAGGMRPCPDAIMDDGLIDFSIIEKISKIKLIINTPRIFLGRIKKMKELQHFRGPKLDITGPKELMIEADGEFLGNAPFEIECLPKVLSFLRPK